MNQLINLLKDNGGFTVGKDLTAYSGKGYAVSLPDHETVILETDLTEENFDRLVNQYREELKANNQFIGCWKANNKIYFDITEIIDNHDRAIRLARERKQLAIFDYNSFQVIEINN